jgi:hypothetical protein
LAIRPEQAVPFIREHIRRRAAADEQRIARLIADLDSPRFAERNAAGEALAELSNLAEPALRKRLEENPPLEVRRRLELLLERIERAVIPPGQLRGLRAVAALEWFGTAEARRVLEELEQGEAREQITQEARALCNDLPGVLQPCESEVFSFKSAGTAGPNRVC